MIRLPFPPSANHLFGSHARGRHRTKAYDAWIAEAMWEVARQKPAAIHGPYTLTINARRPDKRRRDLGNLEKPISDLLVKTRLVRDDCDAQAIRLEWSLLPPGEPYVTVTITPWTDQAETHLAAAQRYVEKAA